jgi:hypothetical protein
MKNKDNDPIFCGKLVKESPVTVEVNILDGDNVADNIEALSDLGYQDRVENSINKKENFVIEFEGLGDSTNDTEALNYILNYEYAFEQLDKWKSKMNLTKDEPILYEFLKIRCEFMGVFVDAR